MINTHLCAVTLRASLLTLVATLCACDQQSESLKMHEHFSRVGIIRVPGLNEISGIQAGPNAEWYVHNDEGQVAMYVIDLQGSLLATVPIGQQRGEKWRDPEDLTAIPGPDGPVLVLADIGDNRQQRHSIRLLMAPTPVPDASGSYPERVDLLHSIILHYPDGPRDCEAMSYDPASGQILFLTKRDRPPRLYALGARQAMIEPEATLEYLGEVPGFRPPTPLDLLRDPQRGAWISQPTGMDISSDGRLAAVITYRSLYLFSRATQESWAEAFRNQPVEFVGPPGSYDEAVGFSQDQDAVIITGEGLPAAIFRLDLNAEWFGRE